MVDEGNLGQAYAFDSAGNHASELIEKLPGI